MARAGTPCSTHGCPNLAPCSTHRRKPWADSDRRDRLPDDWQLRRRIVFARDGHRCQLRHPGCTDRATAVDHICRGDDHSIDNLQAVCDPCHTIKTTAERVEAQRRARGEG